jgi:PAS domain S-box-containing protein
MMTTIFLSALFLLFAAISAYLVSLGLTRSLRILMKGVITLERGDLSGRITVNSRDEIGKVSHAFNSMAEALERREREKRALEEELRVARENLAKEEWERTFDTVPDQIAILDTENRITRINAAMATLLNISKEEAIGTFLFEYFDGTEHPPYFSHMSGALAAGRTYSTEIYKEKLNKYYFITISPLLGDNERTGAVYVARDITANKEALETILVSEERFRIIAENINEVIWMADVELNRMLYISPGYERIFKRSQQNLRDNPRSFIDAVHPEDQQRVFSGILNDNRGEPFDHEYRIIWPDGSIRWIWDRGYPVRNEDGKVTYVTGVAEDITEKKQVEDEKRAIQAKLVQTNKMTSLGLLVSGLAHEVNNPNNCIKLAAHILSKSWDDIKPILENHYREEGDFTISGQPFSQMKDTMPQHISSITANSRRIEGIIKNLRDFAQKGVSNLNYVVDVNTVISLSASILNTQVKQHTRHFKLTLEEGLPAVRGNPQQLEQVIINLVMNAIQALPDREKKVVVATYFDREADCVVIRVKDEGEGMSKEVKDRIFEPFFSTRLDRGGSGLGLAISNFIIKEHKGSLDFESEIGKGTTAIVTLPRQT